MTGYIALALGLVLVVEGLALALAPSRFSDVLRLLASLPPQTLRQLAMALISAGLVLVWVAT